VKFFLCTTISPGNLPIHGSFVEKRNSAPTSAMTAPEISSTLPICCTPSSIFPPMQPRARHWPVRAGCPLSLFLCSRLFYAAFHFRIYTAAVFLPVQTEFRGKPPRNTPSLSQILVVERNAVPPAYLFPYPYYHIKFLIGTGKQRSSKARNIHPCGSLGGLFESRCVAYRTSVPSFAGDGPQKGIERIRIEIFDVETPYFFKFFERIEPVHILRVRMYVRIIPEPSHVNALHQQHLQRINAAVGATNVHQEFHGGLPFMLLNTSKQTGTVRFFE
jgi:hypothetical protein